jgi:hypothetical protein
MKIISHRRTEVTVSYCYQYDRAGHAGWGFGFKCDEHGTIDESAMTPEALANLEACRSGVVRGHRMVEIGVCQVERWLTFPAVGLCDCGEEIELDSFTNTCYCGADYNMSGQRLAPRSRWGEETGETLGEILRIR